MRIHTGYFLPNLMNLIEKYFDVVHFFKFIALVLLFYYFSVAFNGLVSPEGGLYSAFLDQYLNYIDWIRSSIMYAAIVIAYNLGTEAYIVGSQLINIENVVQLNIWLPCLGLGVISFWVAFVLTNDGHWKKKLAWSLMGIVAICFINTWRIALLIIALDNKWTERISIDHHDLFNIVAYTIIVLMMYLYNRKKSTTDLNSLTTV
ncbi:exosortase/archaeosortase family protein [Pedobacter immunditicola]|uniref:exosortase/archaeosortase family protein n=1 Tax=Pedobacter immunditicola TaxID=3133440 RepID=UPI0030AFC433